MVATGVSSLLSRDTIYTLKLRRRGITIDRPRVVSIMRSVRLQEAMDEVPTPLPPDAPLEVLVDRFGDARTDVLPVVEPDGDLLGILTASSVEQRAMAGSGDDVTARRLARPVRELRADALLEDAIHALAHADAPALPVLGATGQRVVGWVTHRDILRAYHRERSRLVSGAVPSGNAAPPSEPAPTSRSGAPA